MLKDSFFYWPYGDSLRPAIEELTPLFRRSALADYVDLETNPAGDIVEHIALVCREWNVNPWWLVISGQREQSIFGSGVALNAAKLAWLGFVGQDVGRSSLPGYYGVFTQVERCVPQSAWLLGQHPRIAWPDYVRAGKTTQRFQPGIRIKVEQSHLDGNKIVPGPWEIMTIQTAADYLQLAYTPHLHILEYNNNLAKKWVPAKYLS